MLSKGPPAVTDVKFPALKEAASNNFNAEVLSFQSDPATISNVQIMKSFKPASISLPKKLCVEISSKKFWKDPIKYEQIFIPKDYVLYSRKIFIPNDVFRFGVFNFLNMPQFNRKYLSGAEKNKVEVSKHKGWWKM